MRLIAPRLEIQALYSICEGSTQVQGLLFSSLSENHFEYAPSRDGYLRVSAVARSSGHIPHWESIIHDTTIPEENRLLLQETTPKLLKSKDRVDDTIHKLNEYRVARGLNRAMDEIYDSLNGESCDPIELQRKVIDSMTQLSSNSNLEEQLRHIGTDNNTVGLVKDILNGDPPELYPTGFAAFDSHNGGLAPGSLFLIAGSTGGGKSTLALALLKNMSRYVDTALVSLEMTDRETMMRLLASLSSVDLIRILRKQLTPQEKKTVQTAFVKYKESLKAAGTKYTILSPTEDMTMADTLFFLKPYRYKVIVIDYVSLLKGVDGEESWRELGAAAREAKIFATHNNCVVILLAQLSEEGRVRYARALVEHAANAWTFVATDESRAEGILDIRQVKARNQMMFGFQLRIKPNVMQIEDIQEGEGFQHVDVYPRLKDISDIEEEA